jgi:thiol-disulfide isomerase/thioredoxin
MTVRITFLHDYHMKTSWGKIAVLFTTDWSEVGQSMVHLVNQFEKVYENITFYTVDVDFASDIAKELSINHVPTLILYDKGEVIHIIPGMNLATIKSSVYNLSLRENEKENVK